MHLSPREREWIKAYAERNGLRHSGISETVRDALEVLKRLDAARDHGDRIMIVSEDGTAKDLLILT